MSEPTELFDHVDHLDKVIGTTNRATAHTSGQLHRVAAVFVFTESGHLYVQEHSRDGKWDQSVGGHVHQGETYAEAAVREMAEELGLTQPLQQIALSLHGEEYINERHLYGLYTCTTPPGWQFTPNEEVHTLRLMNLDDVVHAMRTAPETRFTRGFRITMQAYLTSINRTSLEDYVGFKK